MKNIQSYRVFIQPSLKSLSKASLKKTIFSLATDWGLAFSFAVLSASFSSPFLYAIAVLVVASRQHALLVLMHEGAHGHLHRDRKWNDLIGNIFTAWPLGLSLGRYRPHHWKHHHFTNTAQDPDWGRKVENPHWQFPKSKKQFWVDFVPYIWGAGFRELWFAQKVIGVKEKGAALFYFTLALSLSLSHLWAHFFLYWLVPYLVILPILMKVRSIVEHLGLPNQSELTASRNIVGSPIEAFFFGPHGNSLHLIHHLFPQVPWFQLSRLREDLMTDQSFEKNSHENSSYFFGNNSAFKDLTIEKNRNRMQQRKGWLLR